MALRMPCFLSLPVSWIRSEVVPGLCRTREDKKRSLAWLVNLPKKKTEKNFPTKSDTLTFFSPAVAFFSSFSSCQSLTSMPQRPAYQKWREEKENWKREDKSETRPGCSWSRRGLAVNRNRRSQAGNMYRRSQSWAPPRVIFSSSCCSCSFSSSFSSSSLTSSSSSFARHLTCMKTQIHMPPRFNSKEGPPRSKKCRSRTLSQQQQLCLDHEDHRVRQFLRANQVSNRQL